MTVAHTPMAFLLNKLAKSKFTTGRSPEYKQKWFPGPILTGDLDTFLKFGYD